MIIGVCQQNAEGVPFDYSGVLWPEGFLSHDKILLFNNDDIAKVHFCGMQDIEQLEFNGFISGKWTSEKEKRLNK